MEFVSKSGKPREGQEGAEHVSELLSPMRVGGRIVDIMEKARAPLLAGELVVAQSRTALLCCGGRRQM